MKFSQKFENFDLTHQCNWWKNEVIYLFFQDQHFQSLTHSLNGLKITASKQYLFSTRLENVVEALGDHIISVFSARNKFLSADFSIQRLSDVKRGGYRQDSQKKMADALELIFSLTLTVGNLHEVLLPKAKQNKQVNLI